MNEQNEENLRRVMDLKDGQSIPENLKLLVNEWEHMAARVDAYFLSADVLAFAALMHSREMFSQEGRETIEAGLAVQFKKDDAVIVDKADGTQATQGVIVGNGRNGSFRVNIDGDEKPYREVSSKHLQLLPAVTAGSN